MRDLVVLLDVDNTLLDNDHAAMKRALGDKIATVMVCQGKYAHDPAHHDFPAADITIEGIEGLLALNSDRLTRAP